METDISEIVRHYTEIAAYIAGVISVVFIAFQVHKEAKMHQYSLLQSLEEKYTNLLWKGSTDDGIDKVWCVLPEDRVLLFDSLKSQCSPNTWPIWDKMNAQERNCYRFTRAGLEILEQAYLAHEQKWLTHPEIWGKWEGWMASWVKTNAYFTIVLTEMSDWFTPSFVSHMEKLSDRQTV